jgi:hypothetical protein
MMVIKSVNWLNNYYNGGDVRVMAQAVSRRPLTAEARVRSRVNPCEIFIGQSGSGTGFSPCQFHSTCAPLFGKIKKNKGGVSLM